MNGVLLVLSLVFLVLSGLAVRAMYQAKLFGFLKDAEQLRRVALIFFLIGSMLMIAGSPNEPVQPEYDKMSLVY